MEYVADLHVHSKYSRAVSQNMVLPVMAEWARKKGIDILATADWTHPLWLREIQSQLEEKSEGLFAIKSQISNLKSQIKTNTQNSKFQSDEKKETLFLLSTEISSIYSQGGQVRRIHNLIFSPSLETCEKINQELVKRHCNLGSDGRPIIGLSSRDLIELVLSIDQKAMLIPCHAWTPWFSLYGSKSGFDSIEECFGSYSKYIYGVETGLSSDPEMNWRIKELENRSIISNSDSHSPAKMGREATVFASKDGKSNIKDQISKITYQDIADAIKQKQEGNLRIRYTIEFYPEEGKYHYTGHKSCKVVQEPKETKEKGVICPICRKPLTVGVMHRVEELARIDLKPETKIDKYGVKWYGDPTKKHPPYIKLVPLIEILAESMSSTVASVKVKEEFDNLCSRLGPEVNILLKTSLEDIERESNPKIAEGIKKVRVGDIVVDPGYDGEYGKVKIWNDQITNSKSQINFNNQNSNTKEGEKSIFEDINKEEEPQLSLDF